MSLGDDILKGLREVCGFYDVIFKWVDGERVEELKMHMHMLAANSTIFNTQFQGEMAKQQGTALTVQTIILKDSSPEAYHIFFQLMYGDVTGLTSSQDSRLLFQVYGLAEKYLVKQKIVDVIRKKVADLKVPQEKLISALETFTEFNGLEGFGEIAKELMTKILMEFTKISDREEFYINHMDKYFVEIKALMIALGSFKPADCSNCQVSVDNCMDGQDLLPHVVPHAGLRIKCAQINVVEIFETVDKAGTENWTGRQVYDVWVNSKMPGGKVSFENVSYPADYERHVWKYMCKD